MKKLLAGLLFGLTAGIAMAQGTFPDKPIRLVVGFPAGTSIDLIGRLVAETMGAELKQNIVVENRPGANGLVGTKVVADARPDGYTLALISNGTAANTVLYKAPGYDAIKNFEQVAIFGNLPFVLVVRKDFPARNVAEFISYARSNPGKIAMGHYSASIRLNIYQFRTGGKFEILEVPYSGPAQMLPSLVNDQLQATFLTIEQGLVNEKNGFVRILGVTSAKRQSMAPNIPAMSETVPDFEVVSWQGVAAPAGTPADVMSKLRNALKTSLASADFRGRLVKLRGVAVNMTPEETEARIKAEIAMWRVWSKVAGVEPE